LQVQRLWTIEDVAVDDYFTACLKPVDEDGLRIIKAEKEAKDSLGQL
jgi:hypothetical protein